MSTQGYKEASKRTAPKKGTLGKALWAFVSGGVMGIIGQGLLTMYQQLLGLDAKAAAGPMVITVVFVTALLTGLGLYHRLARFGGAGTLVPITGFANAVASPALDFKAEGFVTGMAAKMFVIAGPVIVYGTLASVVYGVVLWALG